MNEVEWARLKEQDLRALANQNARIIWSVLARNEEYDPMRKVALG